MLSYDPPHTHIYTYIHKHALHIHTRKLITVLGTAEAAAAVAAAIAAAATAAAATTAAATTTAPTAAASTTTASVATTEDNNSVANHCGHRCRYTDATAITTTNALQAPFHIHSPTHAHAHAHTHTCQC